VKDLKTLNWMPASLAYTISLAHVENACYDSNGTSYLVQASARDAAAWLSSSRALNLEVDALGVGLGAVGLTSSVQSDDLVTDNVVARGDVGEGQVPGEVVLDEVVGGPGSWVAAGLPGAGLDLGPLQAGGADGAAVAVAGRNVLLNGANMADRPGVPLESDLAAGLDGNVGTVALTLLVANNGCSAKAVRGDEPVVEVVGLPSFYKVSGCVA
jgi:hypothetical protein